MYICKTCGFAYDEQEGLPELGISPGTEWEELPDSWRCPFCGASKKDFSGGEEQS
ncbi:MAG: rubredoxin [Sphaerochaetaceae bacterium]|jgi:rubredoxin|nr:rubredoxin [Sphaerochaetaceae bacterium]MDD3163998.1 rubredoxin [Sphaerochaetaceae bacterium]MDD4007755.1 rubredoxin [Sphaerochaetaceae bacterium]MDD4396851.1 rubredoxin [Sphaerochaetaceae bacterium]